MQSFAHVDIYISCISAPDSVLQNILYTKSRINILSTAPPSPSLHLAPPTDKSFEFISLSAFDTGRHNPETDSLVSHSFLGGNRILLGHQRRALIIKTKCELLVLKIKSFFIGHSQATAGRINGLFSDSSGVVGGEGGVPNWDSVSLMAVKSGGRGRARCTFRPTCRPNASSAAAAGPSTAPPNWSLFAHQLHLFTIKGVALSTTHVLDTYCSGSRTADQMTGEALESKKYCQLKSASFATCPLRP